jgi:hypothetical protein
MQERMPPRAVAVHHLLAAHQTNGLPSIVSWCKRHDVAPCADTSLHQASRRLGEYNFPCISLHLVLLPLSHNIKRLGELKQLAKTSYIV